ncbi:MAG: hypothetical protein FWG50_07875 [Kiritimatiellaeota bacterium]|nr:hypothetical protein [Kiritimatiellota bacterium]
MKTYLKRLAFLLGASLLASGAVADGEPLVVYTHEHTLSVVTPDGRDVLRVGYRLWGPEWAWTGIGGVFQPEGASARCTFNGKVGRSNAPFTFQTKLTASGKRQIKMEGAFRTEQDTGLIMAGVGVAFGAPLRGKDRATVTDTTGARTVNLPLGIGKLSDTFQKVSAKDAEGNVYTITFGQPVLANHDGEIRVVLAENQIKANDVKTFTLTLDLPHDAALYLTQESIPYPPDWERWFPWEATADTAQPSAIDASGLLDAPAGKHGRVTRDGSRLMYNGKPVKFWGLNTCYESIASPKEVSARRAAFYAKYGINAVRLHKFADGSEWDGVLDRNSYVRYNPEKLARMDYYVAQLKERGIYVLLSANFGRARVYPDDMARVPYIAELGKADNNRGIIDPGGGALFVSRELQDIQIEQLVNLLKHTNAETGQTYAEDPCVMCVELVNEDSALFYNTMKAMNQSPTLKARMGRAFAAWLKAKYGTEAALLSAWGESLNVFTNEKATGEAFNNGEGPVYPVGNPWFYDPDQTDGGMMAARKQRLVDTMLFWYDQQNAFYDRFVAAIRATGYTGEIIASNWQAGRATSHFLNLHSDWRIGMVDRHNYFEGASSMLAVPGSGLLSTGMQQASDRPFMLSEWIHTFPNEFCSEGPAIIGAYGMGLNGWDVSFMFQNRDDGHFRQTLGETWDVVAPQVLGLFPAVSRQVLRGDVKESETVFTRNVDFASLQKGLLNFDDRIEQGYDVKNFSSDTTPVQALAAGRVAVEFVGQAKRTEPADLTPFEKNGVFTSATGELAWQRGASPRDGHITINTPRTQALIGFTGGKAAALNDVTIQTRNPYAAVYVTSLDDAPLATAKRLLVTALARARNTDMKLVAGTLIQKGKGPILMEPVTCDLTFKRPGAPTIHILDHDGRRTGKTLPAANARILLDGGATKTVYYEVEY